MATHSSILAWEIPWTEEPGRLQSRVSQKVGHNRVTEHEHEYFYDSWISGSFSFLFFFYFLILFLNFTILYWFCQI